MNIFTQIFSLRAVEFTATILFLYVCPSTALAEDSEKNNPHYELVMSENDTLCKPLTNLYNELLANAEEEHIKRGYGGATNFEPYSPEKFAKIGLIEPPKKEIHKDYFYMVDFFNEGKPRLVEYVQLLGNGGATETTQILIFKKNAQLDDEDKDNDPQLIDWDLPLKKERKTTARIFMSSAKPYIIVNHYASIPVTEESKVGVYTLAHDGLKDVCNISLM